MQPDELRSIGEAVFGKFWQTALAREIGVADRTVRRWLAGNARIHPAIAERIRLLRPLDG